MMLADSNNHGPGEDSSPVNLDSQPPVIRLDSHVDTCVLDSVVHSCIIQESWSHLS